MDPNLCNATFEFLYKIRSKFLYIKKKRKKKKLERVQTFKVWR